MKNFKILKKIIIFFIIVLLMPLICSCSNINDKIKVEIAGNVKKHDETNIMLHFSTFQPKVKFNPAVRKSRAMTQYISFDKTGEYLSDFTVSREILSDSIVKLNNQYTLGYYDLAIKIDDKKAEIYQNELNVDMSSETGEEIRNSGYIKKYDLSYYYFNIGAGYIEESYISILRIVGNNGMYDINIPYSLEYITYNEVNNQFLFKVSNSNDSFKYGIIEYNENNSRFVWLNKLYLIEDSIKNDYIDVSVPAMGLLYDEKLYEMHVYKLNEKTIEDFDLDNNYYDQMNKNYGFLVLYTYDLKSKTCSITRLNDEIIKIDDFYGPLLAGSQQMPATSINNTLYYFTCDKKINIYSPIEGFQRYNFEFNTDNLRNHNDLSSKDKYILNPFEYPPIKITSNGDIYIALINVDGKISINKYNFNKQVFERFWSSKESILDKMAKDNLLFVSFEIFGN